MQKNNKMLRKNKRSHQQVTNTKKNRNNGQQRRNINSNNARPSMLRNSSPSAYPDIYRTVLVYEDNFAFTTGALQILTFRGNAVYDPDYTNTGHQPEGYDEATAIYSKYKVHGSRIYVTALCGNSSTSMVSIVPDTNPIATVTSLSFAENPRVRTTGILPVGGYGTRKVSHRMTTIAQLGRHNLSDEDLSGGILSNPVDLWYWNVIPYALDGSSTLNIRLNVRLTYDVEFYDRKTPVPSYKHILNPETVSPELRKELQTTQATQVDDPIDPLRVFVTNTTLSTLITNPSINVKVLPLSSTTPK